MSAVDPVAVARTLHVQRHQLEALAVETHRFEPDFGLFIADMNDPSAAALLDEYGAPERRVTFRISDGLFMVGLARRDLVELCKGRPGTPAEFACSGEWADAQEYPVFAVIGGTFVYCHLSVEPRPSRKERRKALN